MSKKFTSGVAIGCLSTLAAFSPISLLALSQPAHAQSLATPSSPSEKTGEQAEQGQQGQQGQEGSEQSAPLHKVDEDHEGGIESIQLIFVGAAIVIALGLAYRAGRRRRDK